MRRKKTEILMQKKTIEFFRAYGACAYHLSPPERPGWFDLVVARNGQTIYMELKDLTGESGRKTVQEVFTDAQIPFYRTWIDSGNSLFILFKDKDVFYTMIVHSIEATFRLYQMTIGDYRAYMDLFAYTKAKDLNAALYPILENHLE